MWIIAASAYTNRREDSPALMDFEDGWEAFRWMCDLLNQGRGVTIWRAGTETWYVQRYISPAFEYFIRQDSGKVLTDGKIYGKL